jgi:hypothetical protein
LGNFRYTLSRYPTPTHVIFARSENLHLNPLRLSEVPITHPNGHEPVEHLYPQMFITLPIDLPRGTVINLFNPLSLKPLAVLPIPNNNIRAATYSRLPIYPPDSVVQTVFPAAGPSTAPN